MQHMVKVSTLRIIFGHPTLNDALLRCFFNKRRQKSVPVRRLWLEHCRISPSCCLSLNSHTYGLPLDIDFHGLESVRFRRLPLPPDSRNQSSDAWRIFTRYVYARSDISHEMSDGEGGSYVTTVNELETEQKAGPDHEMWLAQETWPSREQQGSMHNAISPLEHLYGLANRFDDWIYGQLTQWTSHTEQLVLSERHVPSHRQRSELVQRGSYADPRDTVDRSAVQSLQREMLQSTSESFVATSMLSSAHQALTSLTLDWISTVSPVLEPLRGSRAVYAWVDLFLGLFSLRFPHLRAFQFRNAVVPYTKLPHGLYLLDHSHIKLRSPSGDLEDFDLGANQRARLGGVCLDFMEAHPNLQCLAWPLDHFFSGKRLPTDIASRVEVIVGNLAQTLVDLRVDMVHTGLCDLQTEDDHDTDCRDRRRMFIESFVSKMARVENIKIEGGMPRDERREIIRALHASPLRKVVMIGTSFPAGNTWGEDGRDVADLSHHAKGLQAENKDAIWKYGPGPLQPPGPDFRYQAEYGWPPSAPMIHTIASFHSTTITELKFCGYMGSPVLLGPPPLTTPMFAALKHFRNLKSLIMSFYLPTTFEDSPRDDEIISYWLNMRSPASTALVRITDEEPEGWEKELRTKYAPDALAWRITSFVGPFLSEHAKSRRGGVHVRASFCIGDGGGIFDVDLNIGKGAMESDICLGYKGPRVELDFDRRRSKLDSRRWF